MNPANIPPLKLKHRFKTIDTPKQRALVSIFIAILLGGFAWVLLVYRPFFAEDQVVQLAIIGLLFGLSLLLIYSAIYQILATRIPTTILESSQDILERGKTVNFYCRQAGPINLISLRINLLGEEVWWTIDKNDKEKTRNTRHIGTYNFFDSGALQISANKPYEADISFTLPQNIPATGKTKEQRLVVWKIEIWGKVQGYVNFYHSYPVQVR